ncbi:putative flagellar protein FlgJ [Candidatus Rhodobacter oscarellae]|uniref:Putative flagellar protein FlgJ n=1 Tax=Candidatus Rhodobacter oscarellae TaxID=1675527 RepID=A0A0J9E9B5_9RHOB|nr:rod-binding protein [Candidatus Rhodobacter lobularis]KMW59221.1 putative flagellar protein FlgJ [Candidatus Rhodobacter lobularis]
MDAVTNPLAGPGQQSAQRGDLRQTATESGDAKLRAIAEQLEASFLAEMLKHAGAGASRESFGGGAGEDQFGSFLRQAHAEEIAKAGGIGLAEHLFEALKERNDGIL